MPNGKCGACGTPQEKNHYGDMDCPHCYSENFFGLRTIPTQIKNSGEMVDIPIFEGQGIETLVETNEA
jgi:uncharacterized Zn finger protein (UPF0148 family)